ncbi:hypothetical protein Taro_044620 [Colocasia esculenta]|uniref:Uncharacterized protein n=1 Tax=Colocasia esculenta TaxID=4460 RepID=A0A843X167_COLES|nr:hypothetical protein [Colocasia esculenta]
MTRTAGKGRTSVMGTSGPTVIAKRRGGLTTLEKKGEVEGVPDKATDAVSLSFFLNAIEAKRDRDVDSRLLAPQLAKGQEPHFVLTFKPLPR